VTHLYKGEFKTMKNVLGFIVAVVVAWIVWHLIISLFSSVIHIAIAIAAIALFVWLVAAIYNAMTR
jgi:hypothetical protein